VHRSPHAARATNPRDARRRATRNPRDRQGHLCGREHRAPSDGRHVRALAPAQAQAGRPGERGGRGERPLALVAGLAFSLVAAAVLLFTGRIHTLDAASSVVDALVVRDGRVVFAGRRADVNPAAGEATLDLGGRTVLPGLVDGHGHLMLLARARLELDLAAAR